MDQLIVGKIEQLTNEAVKDFGSKIIKWIEKDHEELLKIKDLNFRLKGYFNELIESDFKSAKVYTKEMEAVKELVRILNGTEKNS